MPHCFVAVVIGAYRSKNVKASCNIRTDLFNLTLRFGSDHMHDEWRVVTASTTSDTTRFWQLVHPCDVRCRFGNCTSIFDAEARMIFEGHLGALWGHRGAILGHLGTILGPSWATLGPSWAISGPSWGHLRPSWGFLGPKCGPTAKILIFPRLFNDF